MRNSVDGDVNLEVGLDTRTVQSRLHKLSQAIVNIFKSGSNNSTKQMDALSIRVSKAADKVEQLKQKQAELAKQKIYSEDYQAAEKELTKLLAQQSRLQDKIENGSKKSGSTARKQLEALKPELRELQMRMQAMRDAGYAFSYGIDSPKYEELSKKLEYAEAEYNNLLLKQEEVNNNQKKTNKLVDTWKALLGSTKRVLGSVGSFIKNKFSKQAKALDVSKLIKKSLMNILRYGLGVRSLFVLFRKLKSYVSEAFNVLAKKSKEVSRDLGSITSAFTTFKNSLGAAFQPLLRVLSPIITQIINMMTQATVAVGKFFAALTGQKYIYKATKANNDYADSADNVANSQKNANKQLGEYDNLQVIGQDSGASGTDTNNLFDVEPIDTDDAISKFVDKLKESWAKADFTDIGLMLGTKIKNALDSIDWTPIQSVAEKIGKSIATFLNGFISTPGLFASFGETLANALNTPIIGLGAFASTFDWTNLGFAMSRSVNSFFSTFSFSGLGKTLHDLIAGALTTASTFLSQTDFEMIGNKIGEFLKNLDVIDLAMKLGDLLGRALSSCGKFIKGSVDEAPLETAIITLIAGLKLTGLGSALATKIGTIITGGLTSLGTLLTTDLGTVLGAGTFAEIGATIFAGIVGAIAAAFAGWNLGKWLNEHNILGVQTLADSFFEKSGLKDIVDVIMDVINLNISGKTVESLAAAFLKGIRDVLFAPFYAVYLLISTYIDTNFPTLGSDILTKIKDGIANGVNALKTNVQNLVLPALKNAIGYVKNNLPGIKITIATKAKDLADKAKSIFDSAYNTIKSLAFKFGINLPTLNSLTNTLKSLWNGIKKWINNNIVSTINNKLLKFTVPTNAATKLLGINGDSVKLGSIPKLAQGAVIPPNKEFLAVLGDQKNGTNIEAPLDTIKQAVREELDARGTTSKEPIILQLPNGKVIAQLVWDEEEKRYKQTGNYNPRFA